MNQTPTPEEKNSSPLFIPMRDTAMAALERARVEKRDYALFSIGGVPFYIPTYKPSMETICTSPDGYRLLTIAQDMETLLRVYVWINEPQLGKLLGISYNGHDDEDLGSLL